MAKELVRDELWEMIEPLLPEEPPKPQGGRPRIDDRAALSGILFVLKSGIPWEMLPKEMGCGSGMTCWRRLKEWHEAGVWEELHRTPCWIGWARQRRSTGREHLWTRQAYPPPGGSKDRQESDR
jgi:transposase